MANKIKNTARELVTISGMLVIVGLFLIAPVLSFS